jgi:hypothetical protein
MSKPSTYRQYFVAVEGKSETVRCSIVGCKLSEDISCKKASNLQDHLKRHHNEFYVSIQASPKAVRSKDQSSINDLPEKEEDSLF